MNCSFMNTVMARTHHLVSITVRGARARHERAVWFHAWLLEPGRPSLTPEKRETSISPGLGSRGRSWMARARECRCRRQANEMQPNNRCVYIQLTKSQVLHAAGLARRREPGSPGHRTNNHTLNDSMEISRPPALSWRAVFARNTEITILVVIYRRVE